MTIEHQTTTEIDVVKAFLSALERKETAEAIALLDPLATYQNVPFPAAKGRDQIARQLNGLERQFNGFEVRYHNIAANGPVVLTERTDILTMGSVSGAFWVCGTFEVHDEKITLWRDRFDFADLTWSFVRGAGQALRAKLTGR